MGENASYIIFGTDKISFELRAKKRSSQSITIKVKPDCQVVVLAPPSATSHEIITAVNQQAHWVHHQLKKFQDQQKHMPPRQYISGECHYYLGEKYVLKITDEPAVRPQVKLSQDCLYVISPREKKHAQQLLLDWYKKKAHEVFNHRLDFLIPHVAWVKERPNLRLRAMRSRWGSCSAKGDITLNTHLVKAPWTCIDYVILHELCHLAEHNHSHRFYRLLNDVCPNWKQTKSYLDQATGLYLT